MLELLSGIAIGVIVGVFITLLIIIEYDSDDK